MISRRFSPAIVLSVALTASLSWATIDGASFPTDGKVAGDRVALRATSEVTSDVIVYVYAGQKLRVLGETGEWYVVELPREYPLWVSKEFVKVGANAEGEVVSDRVNLRAGPGVQYNGEGQLGSRQRVEVLEEKDGWLKLRFVAGDRGFVSRRYVVLAGETAPIPVVVAPRPPVPSPFPPKPEPPRPIPPMPEPPKPVPPKPEPVEPPKLEDDTAPDQAVMANFDKAEALYKTEVKKDNIAEWNLDEARTLYVGVMDKTRNASLLSRCRSRLAVIHLARQYRDAAANADPRAKLEKREEEINREFAAKRAIIAEEIQRLFPTCIAVGRVEKLASAWLQPATHKLIREDRLTFLLLSDKLDLAAYEGRFVGIEGEIDSSVKWPTQTLRVSGVVLPPPSKP